MKEIMYYYKKLFLKPSSVIPTVKFKENGFFRIRMLVIPITIIYIILGGTYTIEQNLITSLIVWPNHSYYLVIILYYLYELVFRVTSENYGKVEFRQRAKYFSPIFLMYLYLMCIVYIMLKFNIYLSLVLAIIINIQFHYHIYLMLKTRYKETKKNAMMLTIFIPIVRIISSITYWYFWIYKFSKIPFDVTNF